MSGSCFFEIVLFDFVLSSLQAEAGDAISLRVGTSESIRPFEGKEEATPNPGCLDNPICALLVVCFLFSAMFALAGCAWRATLASSASPPPAIRAPVCTTGLNRKDMRIGFSSKGEAYPYSCVPVFETYSLDLRKLSS